MKNNSLVNQCVCTKNIGLVEFMYPDFQCKDELFFDYENNIIYTGKWEKDIEKILTRATKSFIYITTYGIPLDNRDTQIDLLYNKWNKTPSENTYEILQSMQDTEFLNYFKKYWIIGSSKLDSSKESVYELYKVLGKSRHEVLATYFKLTNVYKVSYILNCLLTFIEKSTNTDTINNSNGRYLALLKNFYSQYGSKIKLILYKMYTMRESDEFRTLWLLNVLSKGNL